MYSSALPSMKRLMNSSPSTHRPHRLLPWSSLSGLTSEIKARIYKAWLTQGNGKDNLQESCTCWPRNGFPPPPPMATWPIFLLNPNLSTICLATRETCMKSPDSSLSSLGAKKVRPPAWPRGIIDILATGSYSGISAPTKAWPASVIQTSRLAARMAASFIKFCKSAPVKPGVLLAILSKSTSLARAFPLECTCHSE
uniref:Uncharacterized protein n=1 Tax=Solanum lycopersicum TaxID=4081 RepID=A0A3Q7GAZ5_SOLLC